jgi:hypothetical protein
MSCETHAELVGIADLIDRVIDAARELTADGLERRLRRQDFSGCQTPVSQTLGLEPLRPLDGPLEQRGIAEHAQRSRGNAAIRDVDFLAQPSQHIEGM